MDKNMVFVIVFVVFITAIILLGVVYMFYVHTPPKKALNKAIEGIINKYAISGSTFQIPSLVAEKMIHYSHEHIFFSWLDYFFSLGSILISLFVYISLLH